MVKPYTQKLKWTLESAENYSRIAVLTFYYIEIWCKSTCIYILLNILNCSQDQNFFSMMQKWGSPYKDTQSTQLCLRESPAWNLYIIITQTFNQTTFQPLQHHNAPTKLDGLDQTATYCIRCPLISPPPSSPLLSAGLFLSHISHSSLPCCCAAFYTLSQTYFCRVTNSVTGRPSCLLWYVGFRIY